MTGKLHSPTMALAMVLFGLLLVGVHSHGSLTVPRSRNVVNPIQGQTWWKDHGNGHGGTTAAAGPKPLWGPGICGDPFQHFGDTSYYARMITASQATYSAGATINVQWWINANHGGRIGVKLCPRKDNVNQACFDQYPLFRADVRTERFVYIMSGASLGQLSMSANFVLPSGVSCSGGCVLQWEYLTMNSCFEPCNRAVCGVYADRVNPITGQSNMGTCCFGCDPANVPEVFRNCADITITGTGTTPPPSGCDKCNLPASSGGCKCDSSCNCLPGTGGNVCDKCNIPVTSGGCKCDSNCNCLTSGGTCASTAAPGGSCGGSTCCPSGQCCSQWGWCGTTSGHCGAGCQKSFGTCWGARLASRSIRAGTLAGALVRASNATGAPAGVETSVDGFPVSRGAASLASTEPVVSSVVTTEIPADPAREDPTVAPAAAVALERGADPAIAATAATVATPTAEAVDPVAAQDPAVAGK